MIRRVNTIFFLSCSFVLGLIFQVKAQTYRLQIISSESLKGIENAEVQGLDGSLVLVRTNAKGIADVQASISIVEVKAEGFRTDTFHLELNNLKLEDTLRVLLFSSRNNLLKEVDVLPEASWLSKVSIKAFEPIANGWLFITPKELIAANSELMPLERIQLSDLDLKEEHLYCDVFGTVFLTGRDSVIQLAFIDNKMQFYPKESRKEFNFAIRDVLAKTDEENRIRTNASTEIYSFLYTFRISGIRQSFTLEHPARHNCGLELLLFENQQAQPRRMYESLDTAAYEAAQHYFQRWIGATLSYWSLINDSGIVSPARKERIAIAKSIYENIYARAKRPYWLEIANDEYVLLDPFRNRISFLNESCTVLESISFDFKLLANSDYLIEDLALKRTFFRLKKNGESSLVEVHFKEARVQWLEEYSIEAFAKNVRINNGILLYVNDRKELEIKRI